MIRTGRIGGGAWRTGRRIVVVLLVALALGWLAGFLWFIGSISRVSPDRTVRADAAVVLTGGTRRLHAGLDLLVSGQAGRLLVSGVNAGVTEAEIRNVIVGDGEGALARLFDCCIELGFRARDTRGNAAETAIWAHRHGVRSVLLVTSNYHMARSLFEFTHALRDARIEPHPVIAENVILDEWWRWPGSVRLLAIEFQKLVFAVLRIGALDMLERLADGIEWGLRGVTGSRI